MRKLISFLIAISELALRSSVRPLLFLWSLTHFFFANLFLYSFYESKSINEIKKKDLINIRKLCNTFRFIDNLNSTNDGEEFKTNYDNIYPEKLELFKENADKHEASFLDLDIRTRDGEFQVVLFDKKESFPFPIIRMPDE